MQMPNTCLRLKPETMKKVEEIAEKKRRPVSQMLRIIIEDYVEKYEL